MIGNIWEWCSDRDVTVVSILPMGAPTGILDPRESRHFYEEVRGGGFLDDLNQVEPFLPVYALKDGKDTRHSDIGFRIAGSVGIERLPESVQRHLRRINRRPLPYEASVSQVN
jgi:formylglycine-generating enzyme required for sulfatase activity